MHGIALGCVSSHRCSSVSVTRYISYPSKHILQQQTAIPSSLLTQKVGATMCAPFFSRSPSKEMTNHQGVAQKYYPSLWQQLKGNTKASHLLSAGSTRMVLSQQEALTELIFNEPAMLLTMSMGSFWIPPPTWHLCWWLFLPGSSDEQRKTESKKPFWTLTVIFLPGSLYNGEFSRRLDKTLSSYFDAELLWGLTILFIQLPSTGIVLLLREWDSQELHYHRKRIRIFLPAFVLHIK